MAFWCVSEALRVAITTVMRQRVLRRNVTRPLSSQFTNVELDRVHCGLDPVSSAMLAAAGVQQKIKRAVVLTSMGYVCPSRQLLTTLSSFGRAIRLFRTPSSTDQRRVQARAPIEWCDSPFTPRTSTASLVDTYIGLVVSNSKRTYSGTSGLTWAALDFFNDSRSWLDVMGLCVVDHQARLKLRLWILHSISQYATHRDVYSRYP